MTILDHRPRLDPRSGADRDTALDLGAGRSGLAALVSATPGAEAALLVVLDEAPTPAAVRRLRDDLRAHLAGGGRAVLAASGVALAALDAADVLATGAYSLAAPGARPVAEPRPADPLVFDPHVVAQGQGALDGLRFEADDLVPLAGDGGHPDVHADVLVDGRPVVTTVAVGPGRAVVIGSAHALGNRWIAAADNATIVAWALTGRLDRAAGPLVRAHRPASTTAHAPVPVVDNAGDDALVDLLPGPDTPIGSAEFVRAAGRAGRLLAPAVHDALVDLVDFGVPAGGLLIRNLPVGEVPPTPPSPLAPTTKDHVSELVLLTVARRLGQPVGYQPEHGGDIVQNLLPTRGDVARQTSTSSGVELEFHTETAFHPHRPRYLVLFCLRGDPEAQTLLCSISQVVDRLPLGLRQILREPRFRTGVDESFTGERTDRLGHPMPVLGGTADAPTLTFDADLMVGTDAEATAALATLRDVIRETRIGVSLAAGDLLVVDNAVSVHGRTPFAARFDGTDRWLQRTFVVADLAASATERHGRVITTRFS